VRLLSLAEIEQQPIITTVTRMGRVFKSMREGRTRRSRRNLPAWTFPF
jgi:hypothetical protein